MVQLDTYHISPDEDYPDYSVQKGIGYLQDMDVEVHYRASRIQLESIERTLRERQIPVHALYEEGGMVVDPQGKIQYFGRTEEFLPE